MPGEDRWLCTLLLQQGHRVEYCAASDSYTFAPESFNEFFNQRRRWMPSTMANVLDLLMSWRHTCKVNENISFLYIVYQAVLLATSIVGPGIIFMMIVAALEVAMQDYLEIVGSAVLNVLPLFVFVVLCFVAKADTQVNFICHISVLARI